MALIKKHEEQQRQAAAELAQAKQKEQYLRNQCINKSHTTYYITDDTVSTTAGSGQFYVYNNQYKYAICAQPNKDIIKLLCQGDISPIKDGLTLYCSQHDITLVYLEDHSWVILNETEERKYLTSTDQANQVPHVVNLVSGSRGGAGVSAKYAPLKRKCLCKDGKTRTLFKCTATSELFVRRRLPSGKMKYVVHTTTAVKPAAKRRNKKKA